MKAQRFFSGHDTYGRSVELAQAVDGNWYGRTFDYNGYGCNWSKWIEHDAPEFETVGENKYTGEKFTYEKPVAFWGFNKLTEHDDIPRVVLPTKVKT